MIRIEISVAAYQALAFDVPEHRRLEAQANPSGAIWVERGYRSFSGFQSALSGEGGTIPLRKAPPVSRADKAFEDGV
jgi:hypothetical protein